MRGRRRCQSGRAALRPLGSAAETSATTPAATGHSQKWCDPHPERWGSAALQGQAGAQWRASGGEWQSVPCQAPEVHLLVEVGDWQPPEVPEEARRGADGRGPAAAGTAAAGAARAAASTAAAGAARGGGGSEAASASKAARHCRHGPWHRMRQQHGGAAPTR